MSVAPTFRQVGIDPSAVGLAGAVGEIVGGPGDLAWVKFSSGATDWQAFPGSGGGGGAPTAGANISVSGSAVSTVLTAFTQEVHSTDAVGVSAIYKKSRGSSGSPTAVANTDYVYQAKYSAYDGAGYTQRIQAGTRIGRGTTIGVGAIAMDYYIANSSSDDPFASDPYIAFRLFDVSQFTTSNPYQGILALGFPNTWKASDLILPASITNEAAAISVCSTVGETRSEALNQWRPNSAGTLTYNGAVGWAYEGVSGGDAAGNEQSMAVFVAMANGAPATVFKTGSVSLNGIQQAVVPNGGNALTTIRPGLTFFADTWMGLRPTANAFGGCDMVLSFNNGTNVSTGVFSSAMSWKVLSNTAGNEQFCFHVSSARACVTVGTSAAGTSGMFWDDNTGVVYLKATGTSVCIGASGALATNATAGFLGLPSMAGTPTGQPGFILTGKNCIVADTSHHALWLNRTGSTTWDMVPTAAAVANGSVATAMSSVGPAGANTAIQRWVQMPDGAGGNFTVPSWT